VLTPCCCPDENGRCKHEKIKGRDTTGRPINFEVLQEEGHVMFKFQDNSMCENAFAFSRSDASQEFLDVKNQALKHVFTPNYNYLGESECEERTIEPGTDSSDNLFRSKLEVNKRYRYCVRAVSNLYSTDFSGLKNLTMRSSDETCLNHIVRWQASIKGFVTTPPEAGGLPIEDVDVTWELLNKKQTRVIPSSGQPRSARTGKAGTFDINFDELHRDLDRDLDQPIRIRFSKTTNVDGAEPIKHTFLCQDGDVDCTEDGTIVYLKHLVFGQFLSVFDDTTVPVRGKVFIMKSDGCPLVGAEVCLEMKKDRFGDSILGHCVKTDFAGEFALTATIGTRISIRVRYQDHEIVQAPENYYDYSQGTMILLDRYSA
jgi:hypothetical protein